MEFNIDTICRIITIICSIISIILACIWGSVSVLGYCLAWVCAALWAFSGLIKKE